MQRRKIDSLLSWWQGVKQPPLRLDQDGYVSQCSFCKGLESVKKKSLKEIWYGNWFGKLRKKIKKGV